MLPAYAESYIEREREIVRTEMYNTNTHTRTHAHTNAHTHTHTYTHSHTHTHSTYISPSCGLSPLTFRPLENKRFFFVLKLPQRQHVQCFLLRCGAFQLKNRFEFFVVDFNSFVFQPSLSSLQSCVSFSYSLP